MSTCSGQVVFEWAATTHGQRLGEPVVSRIMRLRSGTQFSVSEIIDIGQSIQGRLALKPAPASGNMWAICIWQLDLSFDKEARSFLYLCSYTLVRVSRGAWL
jgi:hypothetical protein